MGYLNALFLSTTIQLHLPPNLLKALCYVETKHTITAIHIRDGNSDSLGICQIKLETAKSLGYKGTATQLMEPKTNIYYAGLYLKHQLERYKGNTTKAVIAYNQGHAGALTSSKYQIKVYKQWRIAFNE